MEILMKAKIYLILIALIILILPSVVSEECNIWKKISAGASVLPGRNSHTATAINSKVYVFGGQLNGTDIPLDELFVYDPATNSWEEKTPTNPPVARAYHEAIAHNDKLYMGNTWNKYMDF